MYISAQFHSIKKSFIPINYVHFYQRKICTLFYEGMSDYKIKKKKGFEKKIKVVDFPVPCHI